MGKLKISVKRCVIMFTDIHDYSILTTVLGQQQHEFLQEVYERLGEIIVAYQGEILKYLGDGMLCIFPADTEEAVIQCAVELRRAFFQVLTENGITHKSELEVGIGSGEVAVGIFGHRSLRMKDVLGEEANRAAVIGHHRGIGITENVYEKIRVTHQTQALPEIKVKWQRAPLRFWEVIV